jgi:hypothetical protein
MVCNAQGQTHSARPSTTTLFKAISRSRPASCERSGPAGDQQQHVRQQEAHHGKVPRQTEQSGTGWTRDNGGAAYAMYVGRARPWCMSNRTTRCADAWSGTKKQREFYLPWPAAQAQERFRPEGQTCEIPSSCRRRLITCSSASGV